MAVCTNVERVNVPKFGADASDKYLASFLTVCSINDSRLPPRAISLPEITVSFWTLLRTARWNLETLIVEGGVPEKEQAVIIEPDLNFPPIFLSTLRLSTSGLKGLFDPDEFVQALVAASRASLISLAIPFFAGSHFNFTIFPTLHHLELDIVDAESSAEIERTLRTLPAHLFSLTLSGCEILPPNSLASLLPLTLVHVRLGKTAASEDAPNLPLTPDYLLALVQSTPSTSTLALLHVKTGEDAPDFEYAAVEGLCVGRGMEFRTLAKWSS